MSSSLPSNHIKAKNKNWSCWSFSKKRDSFSIHHMREESTLERWNWKGRTWEREKKAVRWLVASLFALIIWLRIIFRATTRKGVVKKERRFSSREWFIEKRAEQRGQEGLLNTNEKITNWLENENGKHFLLLPQKRGLCINDNRVRC